MTKTQYMQPDLAGSVLVPRSQCHGDRVRKAKLTSRDIGQMDAYRRMFDALKWQDGDSQTIGILLGTEIDEPEVKYSIMAAIGRL